MPKLTCPCPIYCKFCGAKRARDSIGHRCRTHNCQWEHGFDTCTLHEKKKRVPMNSHRP